MAITYLPVNIFTFSLFVLVLSRSFTLCPLFVFLLLNKIIVVRYKTVNLYFLHTQRYHYNGCKLKPKSAVENIYYNFYALIMDVGESQKINISIFV